MKSGKLMVISVIHNFRVDPNMGIGIIAIWSIQCVCDIYLLQSNSVWESGKSDEEQKRYLTNYSCEMRNILGS